MNERMSYVSSHCVFSTRERRPLISTELNERLCRMTFQEEFLPLLKKHRVDYDERYLWG